MNPIVFLHFPFFFFLLPFCLFFLLFLNFPPFHQWSPIFKICVSVSISIMTIIRVQEVLSICIFRVCILNKLDKTFWNMRITWTYGIIGENFSLPFAPFFPLLIYISAIFPDWGKIDFNTRRPLIIWYHIFISRSVRKANAIL